MPDFWKRFQRCSEILRENDRLLTSYPPLGGWPRTFREKVPDRFTFREYRPYITSNDEQLGGGGESASLPRLQAEYNNHATARAKWQEAPSERGGTCLEQDSVDRPSLHDTNSAALSVRPHASRSGRRPCLPRHQSKESLVILFLVIKAKSPSSSSA